VFPIREEVSMKSVWFALAACTMFALALRAAGEKSGADGKKIVGTWESTKGDVPAGSPLVFTPDGKFKLTVKGKSKTFIVEGSYKVDGGKLKTTVKGPDGKDRSDAVTIKKLTDSELVIVEDRGKTQAYRRKK